MPKDQIERRVGFLLESTTRVVKLSFTKAFKNLGVDITPEQWVILDTLHTKGSLTQKELAEACYKNYPTISRILDNLVKKKYLKRKIEKEDRRKTSVHLTSAGTKLVKKCLPEVKKLRSLSWENLDDKDYKKLKEILEQVFRNSESY